MCPLSAYQRRQQGIKCIVFEKYTLDQVASYERDWNMGLHWGHDSLEQMLPAELIKKLPVTETDPSLDATDDDVLPMVNGKTGEVLIKVPTGKFIRYTRSKLLDLLKTGLNVHYGKTLTDVKFDGTDGPVTAIFNDGSTATGQTIIGCDGVRSTVRRCLLGDMAEPRRLPYTAVWTQKKGFSPEQAHKLRSLNPLHQAGIHPDGMFGFHGMQNVEDPNKPEDWEFFFYVSWPTSLEWQDSTKDWTNEQWLEEAHKHADKFCEPWRSDFRSLDKDHPIWHIYMSDWDPSAENCQWDNRNGRVTLAGDACHSITFQRGQGLNHSVADAAHLNKVLGKALGANPEIKLSDAMRTYDEETTVRSGGEVRLCTMNTHMLHDWSKVSESPVFKFGARRT